MTWKLGLFSELAEFRNGLNFVKNDNGKSVKIIGVSDFKDHIQLESLDNLEEIRVKGELRHEDLLQNDDLLFVRSNGNKELIGRCMLIHVGDLEVSYSGFTIRARLNSKEVLPKFLVQLFRTSYIKSQIQAVGGGTNISNLSQSILGDLKVAIPPIAEQCKIAEILGAWDESIALLEKLITAKRKLKQGLMQQLLTGKKRFKEFEGSDWDIVSLGDLCSVITKGTTPSSVGFEFCKRGINYVKIESINERGQFLIKKLAKISEKAHQALKRSQLKESDILFSIAGALGRVAIVENNILPANTNQALAIIRLRPEYLNCHKYLFQYLKSELIAKHIERINVQAAQANLSLSQLNDFRIIFPSPQEQEKIASVLSAADTEISNLEKKLAAYKQQKRGLMQQLLTGKTRVRVN